jgi:hypothetical protein
MSVINIDFEQAKTLLSEVVEEAGADFVYEDSCVYEALGEPSCMVGRVLAKAGVPVETLRAMDDIRAWSPVDKWGERLYSATDFDTVVQSGAFSDAFTVDNGALELLHKAQVRQDNRDTWGEAQAAALAVAEAVVLDEDNEDET